MQIRALPPSIQGRADATTELQRRDRRCPREQERDTGQCRREPVAAAIPGQHVEAQIAGLHPIVVLGAQPAQAPVRRGRCECGHERFHQFGSTGTAVVTAGRVGHQQDAPRVGDGLGEVAVTPHADEMAAVPVEVQHRAHLGRGGHVAEEEQPERGRDTATEQREQHRGLADRQAPPRGVPLRVLAHPLADADVHDAHVQRDLPTERAGGQQRARAAHLDPPA